MRNLASIQRIVSIEPIEGADRIVKATVLGWECVTQKSNNFKPGDLVVYFEIDSLLPLDNPSFEFLKDPNKPSEFHRLKTIRLKGQYSQGMILPLDQVAGKPGAHGKIVFKNGELPPEPPHDHDFLERRVNEGDDITEILGIKKYEKEIPLNMQGVSKGNFPPFIPKTDETRIQNIPKVLERNQDRRFYITEKIDGSSWTGWFYTVDQGKRLGLPLTDEDTERGYAFGVATRNWALKYDADHAFWRMWDKYNLLDRLRSVDRPLYIQGEIFGPKICENKLQLKEVDLRLFKIWDFEKKIRLGLESFLEVATQLGVKTVPIIDENEVLKGKTVKDIVNRSNGTKSRLVPNLLAEGHVYQPYDDNDGNVSFKSVSLEWLAKYKNE